MTDDDRRRLARFILVGPVTNPIKANSLERAVTIRRLQEIKHWALQFVTEEESSGISREPYSDIGYATHMILKKWERQLVDDCMTIRELVVERLVRTSTDTYWSD